jgi:hypothetical protein
MHRQFTIEGYKYLLELGLKNGFAFIDYDKSKIAETEKCCLLRHDIDADLKAAFEMSLIEKSFGVKATYFLMLRSPVYNLFGRQNHTYVEGIMKNGHTLALHYDEGFYPSNDKNLQMHIETEADILEQMFGQKINSVSFHQPGPKIISNEIRISGFMNTYDKQDMDGVNYFSDSNKIWKNENAWEIFENPSYKKVHLLIHPMWWMTEEEYTTEILWDKALMENICRSLNQIMETERAFGSKRSVKICKP